jgi:thiol oxidase
MMRMLLLAACTVLAALPSPALGISPPRDRGPLFNGSLSVRSLDVEGYEAMLNDSDSVWLVDYYSSWCAHCRMFAPEWEKVGDFYAQSSVVKVGAVNCNQFKGVCSREEVHAYPAVKAHHVPLGTGEKVIMEARARKKAKSVAMWVEQVLEEQGIESDVDVSTLTDEKENKLRRNEDAPAEAEASELSDDTSAHMKYKRLRDAGKSAMLSLENSLFMGTPVLEGERYEAALKWVTALAASFPIEGNRDAIYKLLNAVKQQKSWSLTEWGELIEKWRPIARETSFPSDLFALRGDEDSQWEVCRTYTCGIWTLFHSLSTRNINDNSAWRPSETMAAIRLYMKHFFGCEDCRQHFLEANPESLAQELAASDTNGPHAVIMWAWKMHNSVNKRLKRDQWPSISECAGCYIDIGGPVSIGMSLIHEDGMVAHLTSVYGHEDNALFNEIVTTAVYLFPAQGFSAITGAVLFFALVGVALKTQRHRFSTSKENGHLA